MGTTHGNNLLVDGGGTDFVCGPVTTQCLERRLLLFFYHCWWWGILSVAGQCVVVLNLLSGDLAPVCSSFLFLFLVCGCGATGSVPHVGSRRLHVCAAGEVG